MTPEFFLERIKKLGEVLELDNGQLITTACDTHKFYKVKIEIEPIEVKSYQTLQATKAKTCKKLKVVCVCLSYSLDKNEYNYITVMCNSINWGRFKHFEKSPENLNKWLDKLESLINERKKTNE